MNRLSAMLPSAIAREEVLKAARAQAALREWPSIVGEHLAERSHPDRYDHGTVWVAVESSEWAQELRMNREIILGRLRQRTGEPELFQEIRFGVRPLPSSREVINEPFDEEAHKDSLRGLSIREIAERRLQTWRQNSS